MIINEDFLDVEQLDNVVGNDVQIDAEQTYRFVINIGFHSYNFKLLLFAFHKVERQLHKLRIENFYI